MLRTEKRATQSVRLWFSAIAAARFRWLRVHGVKGCTDTAPPSPIDASTYRFVLPSGWLAAVLVLGDPLANGRTSHLLDASFYSPVSALSCRTPLSLTLRLFLTSLPLSLSRGLARPITGATDSFIHIFLFFFPFFHSQANPLLHPTLPRFLRGFRSANQTRLSLCCCLLWNGKMGCEIVPLCVCVCACVSGERRRSGKELFVTTLSLIT